MTVDSNMLDLCWQVEAACAVAWPTQETKQINGFEFRSSSGANTRRNNPVNPTKDHGAFTASLLRDAEGFYNQRNKPIIVRVPDMLSDAGPVLDDAGYGPGQAFTKTLYAPDMSVFEWQGDVQISAKTDDKWLAFAGDRAQWTKDGRQSFLKALLSISYPIMFAHIAEGDELAAIAYAVIVEDVVIIESVETAPKFRRQGRAEKLLSSLLAKSRSLGANKAALQVVAQNEAARALYEKIGFSIELYGYHYRTKENR